MRRFLLLLLMPVLVLAPALAAHAQTVSVNDPAGDSPPQYDVVHVVVTNTRHAVSTWVTFSDLGRSGEVLQFYFGDAADIELSYGIRVWRLHGRLHREVLKDDENGTQPHRCRKARATWNQTTDVVHTYVPLSCMPGISYTPLEVEMRTSPPGAEAESDGVGSITVKRG